MRTVTAGATLLLAFVNVSFAVSPEEIQQIKAAVPARATAAPKHRRKLLVFTLCNDYKHSSIPYCTAALQAMGKKTGAFDVVISDNMSMFNRQMLSQFDAVCLNNTTKLDFSSAELRRSLMDFVKGGKGIVGVHAATDNFYDWPEAAEMMGGQFDGHPWRSNGTWAVKIDEPEHRLTAAFKGKGFKINDEIYRIKGFSRQKLRVLLSLDMTDETNLSVKDIRPSDKDIPISWVRSFGKGRVFYCSLGHNHDVFWNKAVLQHYLDGIQFALGDLEVDTTPTVGKLLSDIAAYKFGQSRASLTQMDDYLRSVDSRPDELKNVERRFLELLKSDATDAGKQFVCRKLSIIGTEASVPTLAAMLTEKATSEIKPADTARYALQRIQADAAGKALRDALGRTSGKVKAGIINSIAERGDISAVKAIAALLTESDSHVRESAISALGRIGGKEAAEALRKFGATVPPELQDVWANAYLGCGDKFIAEGNSKAAMRIYRRLYDRNQAGAVRAAALCGMIICEPENAWGLIIRTLEGHDRKMQSVAIGMMREMPGGATAEAVIGKLPSLSVSGQVQVLSALGSRGDRTALPAVLESTKSKSADVRIAALGALATLGNASNVDMLAHRAATAKSAEQAAARDALYRLGGAEVDKKILTAVDKADLRVKLELIRSIGRRNIASGAETLLKSAKDGQEQVRLESLKVLKDVAEPPRLTALVKLLLNADGAAERAEAETTVAAVARKIAGDANRQAEKILAAAAVTKETDDKCSLLRVLGKIGGSDALAVLRMSLHNKQIDVQTAAIRALSDWPDSRPMDALLEVARNSDNRVHRILALRGFVRLIGLDSNRTPAETIKLYQEAMGLAPDVAEKKMVLSGLGKVRTLAALGMASEYLNDSSLSEEAAAAVAEIADGICGEYPSQCSAALQKVCSVSKVALVRGRAQAIIERIEMFEDYITDWQVSGKYEKQETGATALFGVVFAPEQGDGGQTQWRPMLSGTDKDQPWLLELDKALGGSDCVAYLRTNVWSPTGQKVNLLVGSNDGIKVWLNNKVVHSNNIARTITRDEDKVAVTLLNGWNGLMMKITQSGGTWSACAHFRSLDGGKLSGLKFTSGSISGLDSEVQLIGDDFSMWRGDTGTWQIAGGAMMDAQNPKRLAATNGSGVIVNGPKGKTVDVLSKADFGDVKAHVEFMVPQGSNSGVYFMGRYEIQVFDSWGVKQPQHSDCGGIYQRWDEHRNPKGYEGRSPRVNASLPPGQWQSYDVIFRAPRFDAKGNKIANAKFVKVVHNGIVVHENEEVTGPTRASTYHDEQARGPLMLQGDHGSVAYRNIRILSLN